MSENKTKGKQSFKNKRKTKFQKQKENKVLKTKKQTKYIFVKHRKNMCSSIFHLL